MSRILSIIAFTIPFGLSAAGFAEPLSSVDEKFLNDAAQGNAAEVQLGELAREKAQRAEVKEYAQMMIDHHNKANDQLTTIAKEQTVTLSMDPAPKQVALKKKLSAAPADKFDEQYLKLMIAEHRKAQMVYEAQAKKTKNPRVTQYIKETLPVVQQHLAQAEALYKQLYGAPKN